MKRFFKKRRSKQSSKGNSEKPNREDNIGATALRNELAGFKLPPKKATEPKHGTKKAVPVTPTEPERKSKNTVMDLKKRHSGGKGGNPLKSMDDKMPVVSVAKSASERIEKKIKGNGASPPPPPPVKENVKEVFVPESSGQDRHTTISNAYDSIPLLEQTRLPRGGISIETKAVGMVQVRKSEAIQFYFFVSLFWFAPNYSDSL